MKITQPIGRDSFMVETPGGDKIRVEINQETSDTGWVWIECGIHRFVCDFRFMNGVSIRKWMASANVDSVLGRFVMNDLFAENRPFAITIAKTIVDAAKELEAKA